MKTYKINNRTISVRKGSLAQKFLEHCVPFAVILGSLSVIALIYTITIMWAYILG